MMYSAPTNHVFPDNKKEDKPPSAREERKILIRHRPTCVSDSEVADDQKHSENHAGSDTTTVNSHRAGQN
jgi:hypothetical protein